MRSDKRQFRRENRRLACEFTLDGHVCSGIVSDLSARGLFIHTTKQPASGTEIELLLRQSAFGEMTLRCRVARLRRIHSSAAVVIPSGFGAEIDYAPEAFFDLLVDIGFG